MRPRVKTVREALQRLAPDHKFWVDAYLSVMRGEKPIIETQYRNPELAGVWVIRYPVSQNTLRQLLRGAHLEMDPKSSLESELIYRLRAKPPR